MQAWCPQIRKNNKIKWKTEKNDTEMWKIKVYTEELERDQPLVRVCVCAFVHKITCLTRSIIFCVVQQLEIFFSFEKCSKTCALFSKWRTLNKKWLNEKFERSVVAHGGCKKVFGDIKKLKFTSRLCQSVAVRLGNLTY